jgi:hypothetical protein
MLGVRIELTACCLLGIVHHPSFIPERHVLISASPERGTQQETTNDEKRSLQVNGASKALSVGGSRLSVPGNTQCWAFCSLCLVGYDVLLLQLCSIICVFVWRLNPAVSYFHRRLCSFSLMFLFVKSFNCCRTRIRSLSCSIDCSFGLPFRL